MTIDKGVRASLRQKRELAYLEAAMDCFIQKGFHATSMRDLAQAVGTSLGNFYNYFKSKDDIVLAIAARDQIGLEPLVTRLRSAPLDAAGLEQFCQDYLAYCCQPGWAALSAEILAEVFRNPRLASCLDGGDQALVEALSFALLPVLLAQAPRDRIGAAELGLAKGLSEMILDTLEGAALRQALEPSSARVEFVQKAMVRLVFPLAFPAPGAGT